MQQQQRPTGSSSSPPDIEQGYTPKPSPDRSSQIDRVRFNLKKSRSRAILMHHSSPRRRTDDYGDDGEENYGRVLPVYDEKRHGRPGKKENERRRFRTFMKRKSVHWIPVIVVLCFLILWWFPYPVNLVRKVKVIVIERTDGEVRHELNDNNNRVSFALLELAAAASPTTPKPSSSSDFMENGEHDASTVVALEASSSPTSSTWKNFEGIGLTEAPIEHMIIKA